MPASAREATRSIGFLVGCRISVRALTAASTSGALIWLSSPSGAGHFGADALAAIAFVPLYLSARGHSFLRAAVLGFACGLAANLLGYGWLATGLQRLDRATGWEHFAVVGLAVYQACSIAISTGLAVVLVRVRNVPAWLAWPTAFALTELCFPMIVPHTLAVLVQRSLLLQIADCVGRLGITWALVHANVLIAELVASVFRKERRAAALRASALVGGLGALAAYGASKTAVWERESKGAPHVRFALVQTAGKAEEKALAAERVFADHALLSQGVANADVVVWPESVLARPIPAEELGQTVRRRLMTYPGFPPAAPGTEAKPWLLAGAIIQRVDGSRTNSALSIDPDRHVCEACRYDKHHLVPFIESTRFEAGLSSQTVTSVKGTKLGVLICFEALLPNAARRAVEEGADALVNITNDGWGSAAAARAHLALARLRAVEQGRSLVRVSQSGISAVIDPLGRVRESIPFGERGNLLVDVALRADHTLYFHVGDCPWLLAVLLFLA